MTAHLFIIWCTEYFKPTVNTYCSEKRCLSKWYCSLTVHPVTQEMYNEINAVFMLANPVTHSAVRGSSNFNFQVLLFKKYFVRL